MSGDLPIVLGWIVLLIFGAFWALHFIGVLFIDDTTPESEWTRLYTTTTATVMGLVNLLVASAFAFALIFFAWVAWRTIYVLFTVDNRAVQVSILVMLACVSLIVGLSFWLGRRAEAKEKAYYRAEAMARVEATKAANEAIRIEAARISSATTKKGGTQP